MPDPMQNFGLALSSHLAGVAFTAAFMGEKLANTQQDFSQIDRVVKNQHCPRADGSTDLPKIFKGDGCIQMLRF
jgi:hypothetical protein